METRFDEIMELCRNYPELKKILDICLPGEMTEQNTSKTIFDLGERNAYNAMISLNLIFEELETGKEVYFDLDGEAGTGIFLFHRHPGSPWCFVIPAGDFVTVDLFKSAGVPIAVELDRLGVNVAVWRHRTMTDISLSDICTAGTDFAGKRKAAGTEAEKSCFTKKEHAFLSDMMKDMGAAVSCMIQSFPDAEDYSVFGFSSGGVSAALWGTEAWGYRTGGIQSPGAERCGYRTGGLLSPGAVVCAFAPLAGKYEGICPTQLIDADYPPVFLIHGELDEKVPICHSEQMAQALTEKKVPHQFVRVADAPHNFGKGFHTEADGWLADAVNFWRTRVSK